MFDRANEGRWWDFGWQLVEGCTSISPGCKNCWSLAKEKRFRKETGIVFHEERLERPLKRKKSTSYSIWNDLFHPSIEIGLLTHVFDIIEQCSQHTFIILTKRPKQALKMMWGEHNGGWKYFGKGQFHKNLWLGVTAENQEQADKRIPILLQIPAAVRFVSVEPMLGEVNLKLIEGHTVKTTRIENGKPCYRNLDTGAKLNWIICGCESGHNRRPMKTEWATDLQNQCEAAGVPFFMKQMEINGKVCKDINQFPKELQVREFPNGKV